MGHRVASPLISRAAAVWCPINPRNEAAENKMILDQFDCSLLLFHSSFAPMIEAVRLAIEPSSNRSMS